MRLVSIKMSETDPGSCALNAETMALGRRANRNLYLVPVHLVLTNKVLFCFLQVSQSPVWLMERIVDALNVNRKVLEPRLVLVQALHVMGLHNRVNQELA